MVKVASKADLHKLRGFVEFPRAPCAGVGKPEPPRSYRCPGDAVDRGTPSRPSRPP